MVFLSRLLMAELCKQSLMTLRRSTGHSFQHCRKALEVNNNDVQKATAWLQAESLKQGWTKLERVESRSTQQGVLALVNKGNNLIALTEMNCETDFVARNTELRSFAHKISETLCQAPEVQSSGGKSSSQMQTFPWEKVSKLLVDGESVEQGRARLVSKIGEKVDLRQSLVVSAGEGELLAASCHPESVFGKYGAALLYKGGDNDVAAKICRHIIGMKPLAVGKMEDLRQELAKQDAEAGSQESSAPEASTSEQSLEDEAEEAMATQSKKSKDNEHRLLMQDFLFDPDTTVGELLQENNMQITKFWRFECSQEVVESKD